MNTESTTAIEPKNLEQRLQENPNHLKELIQETESTFSDNAKYFFDQSNIPVFMEFLLSEEIQDRLRTKGLFQTVKAIQRFQMCNSQYRKDMELFTSQQKCYENKINGLTPQNTEA
jgi:G3E family GTPase